MTNVFGEPFQHTFDDPRTRQGRSKKELKSVVKHDGRVWIARYEGRPGVFFAAQKSDAEKALRGAA